MPLIKAMFGTKLLRAVWLVFLTFFTFTLYDISMISVRCERGAAHCWTAFLEVLGTGSTSTAVALCL